MAGVQVGLNSLYYAVLTSDTPLGATYNSPVAIAGAINAKISPKSNTETLYCDDGPDETVTSLGEIDVEFEAKDIDLNTQAALLGHSVTGGVLVKKSTDTAPYVALGFKSKKSNGSYRYVWLYKGKFALQEQEYQTAEDKPKFQTPKIKGTFIKRTFDNAWQKIGDEDHPDWAVSTGINWFTAVDGAAPGPLTVTISPVDGASGVAADANLTWTFANAIQATDVTAANFILLKYEEIVKKSAGYGIQAMSELIRGIKSRMSALQSVMDEVRSIMGSGMDPNQRNSPSLVDKIKIGVVDITAAYSSLKNNLRGLDLQSALAGVAPLALGTVAANSTSNSSTTINKINITFNGGTADVGEQIYRTLLAKGVRFSG